ncbi:MAG TPA: DmsC/YnfH family molybdoenzyme membrane anchor subunit [Humidesulfovibrio sp.]|uniref:dimethyl sulfoxide reductase anchor subunit family protein n=1 Tax=Humidesulfovibrio sp. TaxID=2910988 RepID=UPI002BC409AD|nr:DmsC/YnfH family molybdoenzyme membrane anchor subunit [Humidesulfovibrio sp.]HWR03413.1 DmsC/YnfH family molybdoenzyme membrane anchor subunit [Humidesulfovibrio sp.]
MKPSMELPLVLFTILSQTAIGLTLLSGLRRWRLADLPGQGAGVQMARDEADRRQWLAAAGLLGVGLLLSLAHLGHPLEAFMALKHLSTSWLSREALAFAALTGLMAFTAYKGLPSLLVRGTAALGLLALFIQGMTYSPPSFPAVDNGLPFALFLISAVILGAGAASLFVESEDSPGLRGVLVAALAVGLAVHLVLPVAWLSGGTVTHMTAVAYLRSPLYWAHILVGLAGPLLVVALTRRIPRWLPYALLAGALCGRIVFYLETVHTAANIGALY